MIITERNILKCELLDGSIHFYDFAATSKTAEDTTYRYLNLLYLGIGTIYSVNGELQSFTEQLHFWRKR